MKQTTRTLLSLGMLAGLASSLGLYAYFGLFKVDQKKALQQKDALRALPRTLTTSDGGSTPFSRLEVTCEEETSVLEKSLDGTWRLLSPVAADVDSHVLESLLQKLHSTQFQEVVEENPSPDALKRFGLVPPQFRVLAQTSAHGSFVLKGGIENSFDGTVYLQKEGETAVYSAQGGVRLAFCRSSYEFRDKTIAPFDDKELRGLRFSGPHSWSLERSGTQEWSMREPQKAAVEFLVIGGLLKRLKLEKALSFPQMDTEPSKSLGQLSFDFSTGAPLRLTFFAQPSNTTVLVLREGVGQPTWLETSSVLWEVSNKAPSDLLDKRLHPFELKHIARLEFHLPGNEIITLQRVNASDMWEATSDSRRENLTHRRVASWLWALANLRPAIDPPTQPVRIKAEEGLGLFLFDFKGSPVANFRIGDVFEDFRRVRVDGKSGHWVEASSLATIPSSRQVLFGTKDAGD